MFNKAIDDLKEHYMKGIDDYIERYHRSLYEETNQSLKRLDEVWVAGLKGDATSEDFREVLKEWYLLNIKEIEIYKKEVPDDHIEEAVGG